MSTWPIESETCFFRQLLSLVVSFHLHPFLLKLFKTFRADTNRKMSRAVEAADDVYSQHRHTVGQLFSCTLRKSSLVHRAMTLEKPVSTYIIDLQLNLRRLANDGKVELVTCLPVCKAALYIQLSWRGIRDFLHLDGRV